MELNNKQAGLLQVLFQLEQEQDKITPTEAARAMGLSNCNFIYGAQSSLFRMGLINYVKINRTRSKISLTETGREIAKELGEYTLEEKSPASYLDPNDPGISYGKKYSQLVSDGDIKKLYAGRSYGLSKKNLTIRNS